MFAFADWIVIAIASVVAHIAFLEGNIVDVLTGSDWVLLAGYSLASVMVFHYLNLYKLNVIVTIVNHTLRLVFAVVLVVAGISIVIYFVAPEKLFFRKLTFLNFSVLLLLSMIAVRVLILRNLCMLLARYRILRRNVLIVGAGETGRKLAVTLFLNRHVGLDVVGFVDDELPAGTAIFRGGRVLGSLASLEEHVKTLDAREVIVCVDNVDHARFVELTERCARTSAVVKVSSPLYEIIPSRLFIERYGNIPVVSVSHFSRSDVDETSKRVFDVVLAAVAVLFLLPVFALIAAAIKLDSRGPVLYRQTRIGRNGIPFTFYKFRSMLTDSDNDEHRKKLVTEMIRTGDAVELAHKGTTKIVNRSRVTRTGEILRKTSLDELPQLFNVIKGDMSLVGPRPCLPYEWENYEEWHKKRLSVVPGCTGVWQVSGRSTVGFRDMVILDLYYIQNASLNMDLKLLFKTIPVMLFGKGGG